jgi:hypothetical protein
MIPYVGYSNETLNQQPEVTEGMLIQCSCGGSHPVEFGTQNGVKSDLVGFYQCNKQDRIYLASVNGFLVAGLPDVSGEIPSGQEESKEAE